MAERMGGRRDLLDEQPTCLAEYLGKETKEKVHKWYKTYLRTLKILFS